MKSRQIVVVLMAILAVACLLPATDAASITDRPSGSITIDDMNGGNIHFTVYSATSFDMTVTVTEGDRVVTEETYLLTAGQDNEISVPISGLSVGTHQLRVECTPSNEFSGSDGFTIMVEVEQNILSNWVTYLVIAIVVIVIAIFAYLKIRDTPKNKPEMTFEELEAQRKADMAQKAEKKQKKTAAPTTEKKRYGEGKAEKKAETPKKEEPKMTFEELDAQKKAEKAEKKQKKSTGLTEREKYLEEKRKKKEE